MSTRSSSPPSSGGPSSTARPTWSTPWPPTRSNFSYILHRIISPLTAAPLRTDLCGERDIQSQEGGGWNEGRQSALPRQRVNHHRHRDSQGERLGLHEAHHEAHLRRLEPLQVGVAPGLRHYQGLLCGWFSPACQH